MCDRCCSNKVILTPALAGHYDRVSIKLARCLTTATAGIKTKAFLAPKLYNTCLPHRVLSAITSVIRRALPFDLIQMNTILPTEPP